VLYLWLTFSLIICDRNWLQYIFPFLLIVVAVTMLALKALKAQGRLGRNFGKVTIQEKPPANTIQKIMALKEALNEMEDHLQKLNVALLKLRTIFISGQTQVCFFPSGNKPMLNDGVVLLSCLSVLHLCNLRRPSSVNIL
jgi:hypothetical protein